MSISEWTVWQIADSAFPTGGFAHSSGLEAAWQCGEVSDDEALARFASDALLQAGRAGLPIVNSVFRTRSRLAELDELSDAFLTNAVANRASRVQGRAFVATCSRVWNRPALAALERDAAGLAGHYAPLFGASLSAIDVPLDTAQRLFLYTTVRGVLAAAVRLGIVGSYHAQRLQHDSGPQIEFVLERCALLDDGDAAQPAPLIDVLQASHDRLYSRLFQS